MMTIKMNAHSKTLVLTAAIYGSISVALAAIGAHALHDMLIETQRLATFAKAVDYTTTGALALIAIVALQLLTQNKKLIISGYLMALGTLLFSGSLFIYILADFHPIVAVTPLGGVTLIIAWLTVGVFSFF